MSSSDEEALVEGIARRHTPPLTVERARDRLERGGQPYRELLQRGHEAFVEALTEYAKAAEPRARTHEPGDVQECLAALERHEVPPWAVRIANDHWRQRYDDASDAAWEVPDGTQLLAAAHYVRMAVMEYAWPGNQDWILRMLPPEDAAGGGAG